MMHTYIECRKTPEEEELTKKLAELALLESTLVQKELELRTLQAQLRVFQGEYFRIVGILYAELDGIKAEILEFLQRWNSKDDEAQKRARQARTRAEESAREARGFLEKEKPKKFSPSESLKNLYRRVAKSIHPDLATDETECARRQRLMAEANRAYEDGNEARLEAILRGWESSPEGVKGEGVGAELIRVIRKIAQVEERLEAIEREITKLKGSGLYQLKLKVEEAEGKGKDLLAEMAWELNNEIFFAKEKLKDLRASGGRCV
jgi:DnaJ-domain-containing protein 1